MNKSCICNHAEEEHDCYGEVDEESGCYIMDCDAKIDCGDFDGRCGCKYLGGKVQTDAE